MWPRRVESKPQHRINVSRLFRRVERLEKFGMALLDYNDAMPKEERDRIWAILFADAGVDKIDDLFLELW